MLRMLLTLLAIVSLVASAWCASARAENEDAGEDDDLPPLVELALQPWTGTFDQMVERKMIRVVMPVGLTTYFLDGKEQSGLTYEFTQEFEKHLRKTLGKRGRDLQVVVIPSRRDRLLDMVVEGRADIAAGSVTVTEDRAAIVDFSAPFQSNVKELIVTGTGTPPAKSLDELVGIELHVRKSTSHWHSLEQINAERKARGAPPLTVVPADELLRIEDLLEMVSAGVIPATVSDDGVADVFARYFGSIVLHRDVPLAEGRRLAWAYRKGDAELGKAINGFVKTASQGTALRNIIVAKYWKNTKWLDRVRDPEDRDRLQQLSEYFRKYAGQYDFDWLMVAAQGYQESRLDQSVRSHAGAVGIMQLLPATAADASVGIPDIHIAEHNIHAGVKYLRHLRDQYLSDPALSDLDRTLMSFAAYNAGPGNLRKAQKRADKLTLDRNVWFDNVEIAMGQTVGREPVNYVRSIFKYYTAFKLIAAETEARHARE
ncbi:MAG: transglycosylase SLT domain-containing protein [Alphaproteobacteria bacterium]